MSRSPVSSFGSPTKHDRMPVIRGNAPGAQIRAVSAPMPYPGSAGEAVSGTRSANR
jgi:hypothetical protein